MLLPVVIVAVIGARLYHVIHLWDFYRENPALIPQIWNGGIGIPGGVAGGALAILVYTRMKGINTARWLDIFAPALLLGQVIGRLGNFVNQELYGPPTSLCGDDFPPCLPFGIQIDAAHRVGTPWEAAAFPVDTTQLRAAVRLRDGAQPHRHVRDPVCHPPIRAAAFRRRRRPDVHHVVRGGAHLAGDVSGRELDHPGPADRDVDRDHRIRPGRRLAHLPASARLGLADASPRCRLRRRRAGGPPQPRRALAERPGILPDVTAAIGDTPLVALDRLAEGVAPRFVAKLEHMNPGGTVKDRIALPMIEAAEAAGLLKPGGVIVEPTSGNTGVGLAQAAAVKGYRCIFVMADKQSEEKRALLRAYGAEVVVCPTDVDPDDERCYYKVSDRLARETPGAWKPDQYHNDANPEAHYPTTGPEIWDATEGRVTHFVVAIGTGGTISGAGRYLKERNPSVVVVGADPAGSVYSGDTPRAYLTEGIGEDFWPTPTTPRSATSSCASATATRC